MNTIEIKFFFVGFSGPLVYTLDTIERLLNRFCPFLAGGVLIGSVYWSAVTYGVVTIMQVDIYIILIASISRIYI